MAVQVQVAQLVAAASDGAGYGIEYTIQKGLEEQKHLYSRVLMGSNGRLRRCDFLSHLTARPALLSLLCFSFFLPSGAHGGEQFLSEAYCMSGGVSFLFYVRLSFESSRSPGISVRCVVS